ncbi:hypothetical protein R3W88_014410 [Solanum pinnatisectum]|uniref:RING-type E3 ubiquitin transferase n=1 Tax=Solanum pinnatisectum TaxID=50273 RepID=A0AAV9KSP9_9SOLN|nr:hypothetical protein R3W88_014410 [Solanum pinnatisectum]
MDSSIVNEIYVFPQICNAKRGLVGSSISGNNFSLEINLIAKHSYTCGDNIIEECHFNATCGSYKYKSLSWDIFDKDISASDFPYPLEKVKWDGVDKILESKDDLIQRILEFVRTLENFTPPLQDDDTICVNLIFVKKVFVPPPEFEITKMNIIFNYCENIAAILWNKTTNWRTYFNDDCKRILIYSLVEVARWEFMSLPAECSICMSKYLPGSEAYNTPCYHSFHSGCIETWLLKIPSCPMCRFKLPPIE